MSCSNWKRGGFTAFRREYTYGITRISESQSINNVWTTSYYGYDGMGSVRQLTSSTGAVTDTYDYDAFGNKVNATGTTPNNYLYRGEQYNSDAGIYYLRARYYNPRTAAVKLKLPTSTVSRALTRLEKDLGALLIRRSSRGHVLTDSGREYLQVCRRALRTLDEGSEMLAVQRERPGGLIEVACPVTMTNLILAPLLKELLGRYPQL